MARRQARAPASRAEGAGGVSYWHNPDGTPAKPFKGEFDWSHVWPLLMLAAAMAYAYCYTSHDRGSPAPPDPKPAPKP